MRRHWPRILTLFFCALLAAPATTLRAVHAQQAGVRWQQDLEVAKTLARQTGRLVLVHVWMPNCAPCMTLDQNVFNQPGVAGAIEAQFVPVKLNANEHPATAQGLGITRLPTDVVLTPDGQVIGRLISPPTPAAYIAEVTRVAREYSSQSGQAYARAAAAAPAPPQLNEAYAGLPFAPSTQPANAQLGGSPMPTAPSIATAAQQQLNAAYAGLPLAPNTQPAIGQSSLPPTTTAPPNASLRVAATPVAANNQQATAPGLNFAPPPVSPTPDRIANPYIGSPPTSSPPLTPAPAIAPAQASAAASSEPAAGAPDPKRLPPGAPPLGFDGYCPVSMRNQWKWVAGDPRWGIVHRGRTYWFAGEAAQQQFWTDPDRYSPALSGMDPVLAIDHQQQVPGKREHSIDYDNLFYMFSSEATLQQFTASPERYAAGVRQAMGIPRGRLVR